MKFANPKHLGNPYVCRPIIRMDAPMPGTYPQTAVTQKGQADDSHSTPTPRHGKADLGSSEPPLTPDASSATAVANSPLKKSPKMTDLAKSVLLDESKQKESALVNKQQKCSKRTPNGPSVAKKMEEKSKCLFLNGSTKNLDASKEIFQSELDLTQCIDLTNSGQNSLPRPHSSHTEACILSPAARPKDDPAYDGLFGDDSSDDSSIEKSLSDLHLENNDPSSNVVTTDDDDHMMIDSNESTTEIKEHPRRLAYFHPNDENYVSETEKEEEEESTIEQDKDSYSTDRATERYLQDNDDDDDDDDDESKPADDFIYSELLLMKGTPMSTEDIQEDCAYNSVATPLEMGLYKFLKGKFPVYRTKSSKINEDEDVYSVPVYALFAPAQLNGHMAEVGLQAYIPIYASQLAEFLDHCLSFLHANNCITTDDKLLEDSGWYPHMLWRNETLPGESATDSSANYLSLETHIRLFDYIKDAFLDYFATNHVQDVSSSVFGDKISVVPNPTMSDLIDNLNSDLALVSSVNKDRVFDSFGVLTESVYTNDLPEFKIVSILNFDRFHHRQLFRQVPGAMEYKPCSALYTARLGEILGSDFREELVGIDHAIADMQSTPLDTRLNDTINRLIEHGFVDDIRKRDIDIPGTNPVWKEPPVLPSVERTSCSLSRASLSRDSNRLYRNWSP